MPSSRVFSRDPGRTVWLLLVPLAIALGVAAEQAAFDWDDPRRWAPDLAVGLTFVAVAVAIGSRRSGTGALLAATGLVWFFGNFDDAVLYVHRGPLVHVLVAFVGWRSRSRIDLIAIIVGYIAAVVAPIWRNEVASVGLSVGLVAVVGFDWMSSGGGARADRRAALWAAALFAGSVVAYATVPRFVSGGRAVEPLLLAYEATLCVVALVLAAHLASPSHSVVGDLVVELGESPSGTLGDALAETLGDPTLEIGYWSPTGEYQDGRGRPLLVPLPDGDRVATYVERESRPFAVLVHDKSLLREPALVEAVAVATRLSAANAALTAELRAQIAEVESSRRRLVLAADEERRRLEVRLHGGVESRLVALTDQLRGAPGGSGGHVARAEALLTETVVDLQQFARGLHPRELQAGLPMAVEALAGRSPVPVNVVVDVRSVLPGEVVVAGYYVCAEALANVAKHARATRVELQVAEHSNSLIVSVIDDGGGGADPGRGTGLSGLIDRVEALGGNLTIHSLASGTRVTAELQLGRHVG